MGILSAQIKEHKDRQTGSSESTDSNQKFPIRTEQFKPDPGAEYKWLVIEPDIFPGEEIVIVMKPEYLAEAEKENPGLVTYLLSEIDALIPHEHDVEFRKKVHMAKKTFGGFVRPIDNSRVNDRGSKDPLNV